MASTTPPSPKLRVTESRNENTKNIDMEDPEGIIRVLRGCDMQLFSGYLHYENVFDSTAIPEVSNVIRQVLETDGMVVVSGAGTSGRLAHYVCTSFNTYLRSLGKPPQFYHLCAGGDAALLAAQESAEDACKQAVDDFERARKVAACNGSGRVSLLIGVSCGFSATYVGAQVEHVLNNLTDSGWKAAVLGFNPPEVVSPKLVAGWPITFKDILNRMSSNEHSYIISPAVGPEAITGSTRMKGGSGTKFILEAMFSAAFKSQEETDGADVMTVIATSLNVIFFQYQETYRETYGQSFEALAETIGHAGNSLRNGGRIFYVSEDRQFGCLGIIDASECPPTYGASFEDVRGFVRGGWKAVMKDVALESPSPGCDLKSLPGLDLEETFLSSILSGITKNDLVVVLEHVSTNNSNKKTEDMRRALLDIKTKGATVAVLSVGTKREDQNNLSIYNELASVTVKVDLKEVGILPGVTSYSELACKLMLNAITTGGHVLKGTTVSNLMVSLRISNAKLFDRATNLLVKLVGGGDMAAVMDTQTARGYILKAVYGDSVSPDEYENNSVADHVAAAMEVAHPIVPIAYLLHVSGGMSREECMNLLEQMPARKIVLKYLKTN
jgi:N-acetylmuramic acid 6-phosphate (MurNAc-6-P) etherase|eukprot:g4549.t1